MSDPSTEKVRFRTESPTRLVDKITGFGDPGTLTIEGGRISFQGKREQFAGRILEVGDKMLGSGISFGMTYSRNFKRWISVSYESEGETKQAYFRGGSHERLKQALEASIQP